MSNPTPKLPAPLAKMANFPFPSLKHPAIVAGEQQSAVMRQLMSGDATFAALKAAVAHLVSTAPKDHDVVIYAFDIYVVQVHFIQPHTFLFQGFDQNRNPASVVVHYSQMAARVVYLPKQGPKRGITGFAVEGEPGR